MPATRTSAPGAGEPTAAHDMYRRFLAASDEIGAAALRSLARDAGCRGPGGDEHEATWAKDAAPAILDRLGAALLAGDTTVLLDHLSVELSGLGGTGLAEAHLIGLVDALHAALPDDLSEAERILSEGRAHLSRAGLRPVRAVVTAPPLRCPPPGSLPGQAFTDLLLLGALACQAPVALLSVPQPDGSWSTLGHGLDSKEGSNDGQLFEVVASSKRAVEVADLMARLPRSPLVQPPHSMRWAYGTALRGDTGATLGVVVLLDRWLREASRREQRALVSLARQLRAQLVQWTRPAAATSVSAVRSTATAGRGAHPAAGGVTGAHWGLRADTGGGPAGGTSDTSLSLVTFRHNLLRSQEVAEIFDVTERTVINWAAAGKLPSLRTIGGHLRFRREDVIRLLTPSADPTSTG